jgi:Concanavalin A-like lectin/glucanases superfamily/Protein of unknown function (DUF1565)
VLTAIETSRKRTPLRTQSRYFLHLLLGLSGCVFAVLAVAQTCVVPPPGMIGWWPGDGDANDIRGGNNGTLQGNATFATGEVLQSFSFLSAGSVNISYSAVAEPAGITVDAWVNPASTVGGASIFNWRPVANNAGITLEQQITADGEVLWNVFASGGTASVLSGATLLPLNTWTHVAGVYDGTTATLYINGVAVASANTASGPLAEIAADATIGSNIVNNHAFNGLIDEVEVFNRPLSADEILAIVNAGPAGKCKDIIFLDGFDADDTPPDTLIDSGPSGPTTNHSPTFTFHSTESGSSFECSIDQGSANFAACSGPGASHTPSSPLVDGSYTFRVRATDAADNPDPTPATRAFSAVTCATPWTVDAVNGGDTNSGKCDSPFKTLTKALSVAASGDTIQVEPGIYDGANGEAFPLAIPVGVEVFGSSASRGTSPVTKIVGNVGLSGAFGSLVGMWVVGEVTADANDVSIEDSTVNNSGLICIHVAGGSDVFVEYDSVTQCAFGVYVSGSSFAELYANTITGNSYNVEIDSPSTADLSDGGNALSCATMADLWTNSSTVVAAQSNLWDHSPPTVSTSIQTGGIDIYQGGAGTVNTSGATTVPSPCP